MHFFFALIAAGLTGTRVSGSLSLPRSDISLSPTMRRLSIRHADGMETEVILCGTAHVSSASCDEVRSVIQAIEPDVVAVELCTQRLSMLKKLNTTSAPPDEDVTFWSSVSAVRQGKIGPLEACMLWMQSQSARMLDVLPGEEFRVALTEARACEASFLLCDRPCQVTLRRMMESLTR